MKKTSIIAALALVASTMAPAIVAPVQAQDAAAEDAQDERPYSVETTLVGTLLDDPAAAAILQRLIPTIYANEMFQNMGRPQTLRAIQQYEGAVLNDAMLARIQAELDALPPGD
jgi:hypothetical protein